MHDCNQGDKFDEITNKIIVVKKDLDEHRKIQQEQDKLRERHRIDQQAHDRELDKKLTNLSSQMTELLELNKDVSNIKIAWKVGKTVGYTLTKFIIAMTVILGAIFALKEWLKK